MKHSINSHETPCPSITEVFVAIGERARLKQKYPGL